MRTIIYSVWNKETNERVYANCRSRKCEEYINAQENPDNFAITYKWRSF